MLKDPVIFIYSDQFSCFVTRGDFFTVYEGRAVNVPDSLEKVYPELEENRQARLCNLGVISAQPNHNLNQTSQCVHSLYHTIDGQPDVQSPDAFNGP